MEGNRIRSLYKENIIWIHIVVLCVLVTLIISFFFLYQKNDRRKYVHYNEISDINYRVYLKENDFFEEKYMEERTSYIASLIDYIDTDFLYSANIPERNINFKYSYYIDAEVNVVDRNDKVIFDETEMVKEKVMGESRGKKQIRIDENVKIDYQHYNDLIKNFVQEYQLSEIKNTLLIHLHVNVVGEDEEFEKNEEKESVVSLVIPLTSKTMSIDITDDLVENSDKILVVGPGKKAMLYLFGLLLCSLFTILWTIYCIKYYLEHRSPYEKYRRIVDGTYKNYKKYIQKVQNRFNWSANEIVDVEKFTDLLEIRDALQQPILMFEDQKKMEATFVLPSENDKLYRFKIVGKEKEL